MVEGSDGLVAGSAPALLDGVGLCVDEMTVLTASLLHLLLFLFPLYPQHCYPCWWPWCRPRRLLRRLLPCTITWISTLSAWLTPTSLSLWQPALLCYTLCLGCISGGFTSRTRRTPRLRGRLLSARPTPLPTLPDTLCTALDLVAGRVPPSKFLCTDFFVIFLRDIR